jgi:scyllo-inositol 2-dehydrogenase (NADP+)
VQLVGIYEPEGLLVERYAKEFRFSQDLVHQELAKLLDLVKPEAVLAFSSLAEHLSIVEAAAPRGIHVMVEKPLAFRVEDARKIEAFAKRHGIHVLTNYETTWYPSGYTAFQLVHGDQTIGPIRKVIVRDGHFGPREVGVGG